MATSSPTRPWARWLAIGAAVAVAVAAVVAIVVVGRGARASDIHVDSGGAARAGQVPPQFSGTTVSGQHFDMAAERGRVVMVNFFATWCSNCRAELPLLQRTWAARHGDGLDLVTVDFQDSGDAAAFLRQYRVAFPALLDPSSDVGHAYLVSDLPTTFFVGRDGRVASVFHGQLSQPTLDEALRGLL